MPAAPAQRPGHRRCGDAPSITPNSCDVLCIASNEGPYIEFIHHYLHGFSNLFIGILQTGPIVEAIAAHHPQVHAIRRGQQSYASLYSHASRASRSSHCLIVDVDEFWVAKAVDLGLPGNTPKPM